MIDGIKIALPGRYKSTFLENPLLVHRNLVDGETGEVEEVEFEPYIGLRIIFITKKILIKGSLHKTFNLLKGRGDQNYDDFTYQDLKYIIEMLSLLLQFELEDAEIQTLEYGVNMDLSIPPSEFLGKNLVLMKDRRPERTPTFNGNGNYAEFAFSQYFFKIYDKGRQYKRNKNILRVELKAMKSQLVRNIISKYLPLLLRAEQPLTLDILLERNVLKLLGWHLMKYIDTLLIVDTFDPTNVTNLDDRQSLQSGSNPNYWTGLLSTVKPYTFQRRRRQFKSLLKKYNLNKLHREIASKTTKKWNSLVGKACLVFTY